MNHEANAKRFTSLRRDLAAVHAAILGILAILPIPVILAPLAMTGEVAPDEHPVFALYRAAILAGREPVTPMVVRELREMITEFQVAYELATLADRYPHTWRLDGIESALYRCRQAATRARLALSLMG